MGIGVILVVVLVIILAGGLTGYGGGPFYGRGYPLGGGLGLLLLILIILLVLGKL
jgi:hypothetical protein